MKARIFTLSLSMLLPILFSSPLYAEENKNTNKPRNLIESSKSGPNENAKVEEKISQKREEIAKEAVAAIEETRKALTVLEKSVGKLDVVLARVPDLALATIDTKITIHDLVSTLKGIEKAKKQVENYLESINN